MKREKEKSHKAKEKKKEKIIDSLLFRAKIICNSSRQSKRDICIPTKNLKNQKKGNNNLHKISHNLRSNIFDGYF